MCKPWTEHKWRDIVKSSNEPPGSTESGKLLEQKSDGQLVNTDSNTCSRMLSTRAICRSVLGTTVNQGASGLALIALARVLFQGRKYGICDGQNDHGTVHVPLPVLLSALSQCQYIQHKWP